MLVADRMTRVLQTCRRDETLERAAQLMWEGDCGCLPVTGEHGHLHGMITDRDVCMAAYTTGRRLAELQVCEAMAIDVASLQPTDTLRAAESLMREHRVRRLPVLDDEDRVIGILTSNDLIRWVDDAGTTTRDGHDAVHLVRTLATVGTARSAPTPAPAAAAPLVPIAAARPPLPAPAPNLTAMRTAIGVAVAARHT